MVRRLLRWRRLRWFAAGTLVRFVVRRSASRSVDRATAEIEDRLPTPVLKALDIVPARAVRAGGSAVVAARAAKRVATGSRRVSRLATVSGRRVAHQVNRVRSIGHEIGDEIGHEAELRRRELKAEYLRFTRGQREADDELLDLRRPGREIDDLGDRGPDELAEVSAPVRPGRWRAAGRLPASSGGRVQRTYRPRSMPWDR